MGNNSSSENAEYNQIPTVKHIFEYGPQFDHDARLKVKTEDNILPFKDNKNWKEIVSVLNNSPMETAQNDESDDIHSKITSLENLFESLSEHKARTFIRYLKSSILTDKKELITTFLSKTVPFMKLLLLKMPELLSTENEFKYMQPRLDKIIKLTRIQIASLLCACFFDLSAPHCCFSDELQSKGVPGKFDCYMHYFEYVRLQGMDSDWAKEEVIIYRRCLKAADCPFLEHTALLNNGTVLCDFKVYEKQKKSNKFGSKEAMQEIEQKESEQKTDNSVGVPETIVNETIEDCRDGIHADFANEYIGGGVLNGGNVQEEIRFTVNTECIISKLLCPQPMENDEAIIICNSQQFCDYTGYGGRFRCSGLAKREMERHKSVIVGIDAVNFFSRKRQYRLRYMMRELCKAYIGFSVDTEMIMEQKLPSVGTGNWGCGMFGGDPQFKAMIQWIAVTLANRKVAYYTFNDKRVENRLKEVTEMMSQKKVTVGQLWKILNRKRDEKEQNDMFDILEQRL